MGRTPRGGYRSPSLPRDQLRPPPPPMTAARRRAYLVTGEDGLDYRITEPDVPRHPDPERSAQVERGKRPPPDRSWVQTEPAFRAPRMAARVLTVLLVLCTGAGLLPGMPDWWYPLTLSITGVWFAAVGMSGTPPTRRNPFAIVGPGSAVDTLDDLDTPWKGTGHVHQWCQGCDTTPNVRLMGWTEDHRYRCRTCGGRVKRHGLENPPPRPPKGGAGVVVARDWGRSRTVTG